MDKQEYAQRSHELRKGLYRTAYLYLGNEAEALDAVDETIYKGLKSLKKLRQPEFFSTWLTRILINECKSALRRRRPTVPLDSLPEFSGEDYDSLPLRDALSRLPEEIKAPIILRYFTGLTTAETAKTLGIPQGTAATRVRRGLALMKLELSEEEFAK